MNNNETTESGKVNNAELTPELMSKLEQIRLESKDAPAPKGKKLVIAAVVIIIASIVICIAMSIIKNPSH